MAYTARLCNPTPWDVKLPWDRGVNIRIAAFGAADLTMQQMEDFSPGKPGHEEIRGTLDHYGLFLMDADRSYDVQALGALKRSYAAKKERYDGAFERIRANRSAQGVAPDADALEEQLRQMGFVALREQINVLKDQIAKFETVVKAAEPTAARAKLDPTRTVYVTNPPREFPSVAAMEFFLEKNPEIARAHEANKGKGKPRGVAAMSPAQQVLRAEAGFNDIGSVVQKSEDEDSE